MARNSPMAQWLGLDTFTARAPGSIPGWGIKILQVTWCIQKKKKQQKEYGSGIKGN